MKSARGTGEDERRRWNEKYRRKLREDVPQSPSELLVKHEALLRSQVPGRALDLACGLGRNAFYLARLGFTVEALDISEVAIAHVRRQAAAERLNLRARITDLQIESLPPAHYDVVVNCNFLVRRLFAQIKRTLAPGGVVLFETFLRDDPAFNHHSPDPEYFLEPGELLQAFKEFEILYYQEGPKLTAANYRKVAILVARKAERRK